MINITKFKGKKVTIDGIVGTIHQEKDNGFCEFVFRDEGCISSMRMARPYIKTTNSCVHVVKDEFRNRVKQSAKIHYPIIQTWIGYDFPNGEYISRDFTLKEAGI